MICHSASHYDTISLPTNLNSLHQHEVILSKGAILVKTDSVGYFEYNLADKKWNKLGLGAELVVQGSDNTNSTESPFSNKLLLPLYFLIGTAVIYGFMRLLLMKNEYDSKLDLEKLQRVKLEEINQVKVNFYNMVSHELKTPLTLILGPIQELKKNLTTEKNSYLIDFVNKNANKLKVLIEEILDYKNHEFEYFDIKLKLGSFSDFVEKIGLNFKDNAARKGISITCTSTIKQPYSHFDPKLMELVINNLIVNSLKFSSINENIEINLWEEGVFIYFRITDQGTGILAKDLPHIFKKYYQGKKNQDKGSGIGLALVKEIIQKHKGDVEVESRYRKGTTITFHFPKNLEQHLPQYIHDQSTLISKLNSPISEQKENDTTILIVDDNEDIRRYLSLKFQEFYNVILANDGIEGYNKAIAEVPDLIISDVSMPNLNGMDMCKRLKTDPATDHIPIILLTVRSRNKYLEKSLQYGADTYIMKPFDIQILLQTVVNSLNQVTKIQSKYRVQIESSYKKLPQEIKHSNEFVAKYVLHIKNNLENPLFSTDYIADQLNLSSSQSYRKIKSLTGMTPNQIILNIRLEEAYKLITQTELKIINIIGKVGLNDPKYFRKKFREKYDANPSDVRKIRTIN